MKLPISRMQRDSTDSTVLRNMDRALGNSLLAYESAIQGIEKLQVNEALLKEDLDQTSEVFAEAIQAGESSKDLDMSKLTALDGHYWGKVKELASSMSEFGLIYFRVLVEIKWLLKLSNIPEVNEVPSFSREAEIYLLSIIDGFSLDDALEVKNIEKATNQDVRAVEYFLKQKCESHPEIAKVLEFFHFACTSEDINNLSHGLMLQAAISSVILPAMDELIKSISLMAKNLANVPMLSETDGQQASPTTLGKEMGIFANRLSKERRHLSETKIKGNFEVAVGNYNDHMSTDSNIDWHGVAEEFVISLGLTFNPYVTQIEPHDYMARLFHTISQFNNILIEFDRDVWKYISLGYFKQIPKAGEIGSSTMPHQVNAIDFENSEGNLGEADAELASLSMKLPISQMQTFPTVRKRRRLDEHARVKKAQEWSKSFLERWNVSETKSKRILATEPTSRVRRRIADYTDAYMLWEVADKEPADELVLTKDWDLEGMVGVARNQFEHDNCWTYTATDHCSAWRLITKEDIDFRILSAKYLTYYAYYATEGHYYHDIPDPGKKKRPHHDCHGYRVKQAIEYIRDHGVPEEDPNDAETEYSCVFDPPDSNTLMFTIPKELIVKESFELNDLYEHLLDQPVSANVHYFYPEFEKSGSDIYVGPLGDTSQYKGLHSVLVTSVKRKNGKLVAVVKSSHGGIDGVNGFVYVSLSTMIVGLGNASYRIPRPCLLLRDFTYIVTGTSALKPKTAHIDDPSCKIETSEQRELTDSTVMRNMGGALRHSLLAYKSAIQGIGKLEL